MNVTWLQDGLRQRGDGQTAGFDAASEPGGAAPAWRRIKRFLDPPIASLLLILLAPLLLILSVAIKLDSPGPVLFRQRRLGQGGREFTVCKFRTMTHGASCDPHREYIGQTANGNGDGARHNGLMKLTRDPRVTRVGGVLRRMSLDEVPNLLNVVTGQMSIVGPRPAISYELDFYDAKHFERFAVKPGLTGLWQVSGRSRLGFSEMLELDVEYAQSGGFRTDLRILLMTPRALMGPTA